MFIDYVYRGRRGEIDFVSVRAFVYCGRERGRERLEYDFVSVRAFVYCGREREREREIGV